MNKTDEILQKFIIRQGIFPC